jgi:hypothetical protein
LRLRKMQRRRHSYDVGENPTPIISESATINAEITDVFDLISRIEEFPLYASMLKKVRKIVLALIDGQLGYKD